MCFRESAENTKLLKRCAHLGNTDDTGLLIQNAAPPHTVNSWPAIGLPIAIAGNDHLTFNIILSGKNLKTECSEILNNVSVYVFWVNPSIMLMGKATLPIPCTAFHSHYYN